MEMKNIKPVTGIKDDYFGRLSNMTIYQVEWSEHFQELKNQGLIVITDSPASISWEKLKETARKDIQKYYSKMTKIKTNFVKIQNTNRVEQEAVVEVVKEKLNSELNSILNKIENITDSKEDVSSLSTDDELDSLLDVDQKEEYKISEEELSMKIDELDDLFEEKNEEVNVKETKKRGK